MKTCKDCIHYDVCYIVEVSDKNEIADYCCSDFKDVSKFIELPCAIGDTVYMVVNAYDSWDDSEYRAVIQAPFKLDMLKSFNKRFFLTREEAEKKLEELNERK